MNNHKKNAIEKQICTIVADLLCLDECSVPYTANIREELGADSLEIIEIIMALANTFDIEVCDEGVLIITTIDEIAAYVMAKASPRTVQLINPV